MRKTTEKYIFPINNVTLKKGYKVWIPIYAIQRDPKYYPNPEVFDPERFNDEINESRHPMLYLPFGDGPRNCIGNNCSKWNRMNLNSNLDEITG